MKTTLSAAVDANTHTPRLAFSRVEAAASLGVHPGTIDRFVKSGQLRPSRASRRPLFPVSEIERFLRETTFDPISQPVSV